MSYIPTNWKDGDIVTATKLNKLEQGVMQSGNDYTAEKVEMTIIDSSFTNQNDYGVEITTEIPLSELWEDINELQDWELEITFDGTIYQAYNYGYDSISSTNMMWLFKFGQSQEHTLRFNENRNDSTLRSAEVNIVDNIGSHTITVTQIKYDVSVSDNFKAAVLYVLRQG